MLFPLIRKVFHTFFNGTRNFIITLKQHGELMKKKCMIKKKIKHKNFLFEEGEDLQLTLEKSLTQKSRMYETCV